MTGGAAFRGQPLLLLAGLLFAWLGLRVMLWQPPFAEVLPVSRWLSASASPAPAALPAERFVTAAPAQDGPRFGGRNAPLPPAAERSQGWPALLAAFAPATKPRSPIRAIVGHNLLLAAGLGQLEMPAMLVAYVRDTAAGPGVPAAAPSFILPPRPASSAFQRWSADGWLLLRRDTTAPFLSGRPSYGRSQAGAVLRYNLASGPRRPQAYLRASMALAGPRERDVAAGLSLRPLPGLPVRVAAEARVSETDRGTQIRPAAYAVTELPQVDLPLGGRAEAYLQAGYVGGEFATAFVDGQARVDRPFVRLGDAEFTAGGGAWGGAQKGAARLDIGPTAALSFRLGDAYGRVAADYRFRVAGDAEPSSGAALTVSAGF